MSNKKINDLNYVSEGLAQTRSVSNRLLEGNIFTYVLTILSVIAAYFIFKADSFPIVAENGFNTSVTVYTGSLADLVSYQFYHHSLSRVSLATTSFILSFVLIAIGIVGIIILIQGKMEDSRLLCGTAIAQIPTGILMLIASSVNNTGFDRFFSMNEETLGIRSLLTAYWLYFVCYLLLFISSIMIAVQTRKREYKHLRSSVIAISVGFGIMITAVIFSITSVKLFFDSYFHGAIIELLAVVDYLPGLLISTVLAEFAKIIMIVSFLFGIIKFQKGVNKKFDTVFRIGLILFILLRIAYTIVIFLYSFTLIENTPGGLDTSQKIWMREVTISSLSNFINVLFWLIFLAGTFSVIKSTINGEFDDEVFREIKSSERARKTLPIFEGSELAESVPVQHAPPVTERFCTVCGTVVVDDSIVCDKCGSYVPKT